MPFGWPQMPEEHNEVLAEWVFRECRYRALDKGSQCWIVSRELATEGDFPSWQVVKIL